MPEREQAFIYAERGNLPVRQGIAFQATCDNFLIRHGLGSMKIPVIVYIVIISVMVVLAVSTFTGSAFTTGQAWLIFIGASLFYISDVILAANRFWKSFKYHRISLAFYYAGQCLIALAASHFV